ncbi:MAG: histidine kinase [Alistipes onderdonkii]
MRWRCSCSEKHDDKALTYIDQLSYTFRYIIQNGQSTLMTLDEELKFIEAVQLPL